MRQQWGSVGANSGARSAPTVGLGQRQQWGLRLAPTEGYRSAPTEGLRSAPTEGLVLMPTEGFVLAPTEWLVSVPTKVVHFILSQIKQL